MAWSDGNHYLSDVEFYVEVEEREEQVYADDGQTPMTKAHAPTEAIPQTHRTKLKLKRYFYRLCLRVVENKLIAGSYAAPSGIGGQVGRLTGTPGFSIPGDSGVKYLCTGENASLMRPECGLWRHVISWTGYGEWKKVPASWGLDQTTEEIADNSSSGSRSGSRSSG